MRTTRTEPGGSGRNLGGVVVAAHFVQALQPGAQTLCPAALLDQDPADLLGDHHRVERIAGREQLLSGAVVLPAVDATPVPVVKDRLLQLHLDQLALFLDADDQLQVLGPFLDGFHVHRPGLSDLVGGQAQPLGLGLVDAQQGQGMHQIQPVLARGDKADPRAGLAPDLAVDAVRTAERLGRPPLVVDHPGFLRDRRVAKPDVQTAIGQHPIRHGEHHPVRIAVDDRCRLDRVLHRLQARPNARVSRQREPIQAVVQDLLHARGRQHRDIGVDHRPVRLVQHGRAFARVIVAHRHHDATVAGRSGHVAMPHHVARPIHARPLAIPQRIDAIMAPLSAQFGLLTAPDRGRGQILVQTRLEQHLGRGKALGLARHLQIDTPQRRTAISGDKPRRIKPRGFVACRLHQHQPDKCLRPVQQHVTFRQIEPIG